MVKVGIVGLGTVAQLMHLPILSSLYEKYQIYAVSDVSPSLMNHIAEKYNCKTFASPYELMKDPEVDAVFVLSPDQYHADYSIAAMQEGKHVFIEKPAALNLIDLRRMRDCHKENPNLICMVGYMRRYANGFLKCKSLLEEGNRSTEYVRLRDIILEGDFFINQTKRPFIPVDVPAEIIQESKERRFMQIGAALGDGCTDQQRMTYTMFTGLGCHTLSAARELFGLPSEIKSVVVKGEQVVAVLKYDQFLAIYEIVNDQKVVQFDATIEVFQGDRLIRVKYETPYLRYQPHQVEVIESTLTETQTTVHGPYYQDAFENELVVFQDCIKSGRQPKTTLEDSIHDLTFFKQLIEKIS